MVVKNSVVWKLKTDYLMQDFICGVHYLEFVWPALVVLCIRTLQLHKTWYAIYLYVITCNAKLPTNIF